MKNTVILAIVFLFPVRHFASAAPDELLDSYRTEAKRQDPGFREFSAEAGHKLYLLEQKGRSGETISCSTCHTADPRQPGKTRANKVIEPLAPSVNAQRFTDREKVEKWFRRNCGDVLRRECSAKEKGDFVAYLRSIKP